MVANGFVYADSPGAPREGEPPFFWVVLLAKSFCIISLIKNYIPYYRLEPL